jgi:hypothetical protein
MVDTDDLALWYAINRLITNYWAEVHDNGGSHAHEFYEPEAVYTVGNNRFEGADKIRALYPAAPARHHHHASPHRQSSSVAGRRASGPGNRSDESLPRSVARCDAIA